MYDFTVINEALLTWYVTHARKLPWREQKDPYRVWVSEIMLQQTRVEVVKEYYLRFLKALPDVEHLAYASEEQLLKLWEGLGYYSRVRNMKKAAITILEEYEKKMPASYEQLQKLAGIGSYTAAAVASMAFQIPVAAVDGNLMRVAARLSADFSDTTSPRVKKEFENVLTRSMDKEHPGEWNQAMMDLGATVCIPGGRPRCEECPLRSFCTAFHDGCMQELPIKSKKTKQSRKDMTVLVFTCKELFAIQKRPDKGLLAGLWEFPVIEGHLTLSEIEECLGRYGTIAQIGLLGKARHVFSHVIWDMIGYKIEWDKPPDFMGHPADILQDKKMDLTKLIWKTKQEIEENYGVASALSAYKKQVWKDAIH